MRTREICGGCKEKPVRAEGQWYCRDCQRAKDNASAISRRAELRRLREEVKMLRRALQNVIEAASGQG